MSFCSTIRGPAAAETCMSCIPGNPQVALASLQAVKNAFVIPQVNRPRAGDQPLGLKALSSYAEVTSFKLIPFSAFWAKWRRVASQQPQIFRTLAELPARG